MKRLWIVCFLSACALLAEACGASSTASDGGGGHGGASASGSGGVGTGGAIGTGGSTDAGGIACTNRRWPVRGRLSLRLRRTGARSVHLPQGMHDSERLLVARHDVRMFGIRSRAQDLR